MKIKTYQTKQEVAIQFSHYLAILIASKMESHIALSGGSTPKIVFDELAANFKEHIDWRSVHFYWGDERCVDPSDDQSNYKMTVAHLLSKIDIPKENIHRIKGENDPDYEAKRYSELLEEHLQKSENIPQFDLVILGMGDDGHTASIFPHEINLWYSENFCEVATHPDTGQKRVSITGKLINHAKTVAILVTGATKADKLDEVLNKKGNFEKYPASLVNPKSGKLLWFIDNAAAEKLTSAQS